MQLTTVRPVLLKYPGGQAAHLMLPVELVKYPEAHELQEDEPAEAAKVPAEQFVH